MRPLALLILAMGAAIADAQSAESIFIGRALSEKPVNGVEWRCSNDDRELCVGNWWRMQVKVERMLAGPPISGRVSAATVLSSSFTPKGLARFKLFVIKPIEDKEKSALLHTPYLLKHFAHDGQTVCLQDNPAAIGFAEYPVVETVDAGEKRYCFAVEGN